MYDIAVLGGDIRHVYMVPFFHNANLSVITYGLSHPMLRNICVQGISMKETIEASSILVSSIPFSKDGTTIPSLTSDPDITVESFTSYASSSQTLFAGMLSEELKAHCSQNQIQYYDFMEDDCVAIANGIATAEGAIMEAITKSPDNLHKSHCLVLGFGRCAKTLAWKLKGLDALVTIAARNPVDRSLAEALGFYAIPLTELKESIDSYNFIFNSIPALVLDSLLLSKISKETVIIDIASAPGGVDYVKAKELGLNATLSLGIPGRIAPKASARILADTVLTYLFNRKKG